MVLGTFLNLIKGRPKSLSSQSWSQLKEVLVKAEQLQSVQDITPSNEALFLLFGLQESLHTHLDNPSFALDYISRALQLSLSRRPTHYWKSVVPCYSTTPHMHNAP